MTPSVPSDPTNSFVRSMPLELLPRQAVGGALLHHGFKVHFPRASERLTQPTLVAQSAVEAYRMWVRVLGQRDIDDQGGETRSGSFALSHVWTAKG